MYALSHYYLRCFGLGARPYFLPAIFLLADLEVPGGDRSGSEITRACFAGVSAEWLFVLTSASLCLLLGISALTFGLFGLKSPPLSWSGLLLCLDSGAKDFDGL